MRKLRGPSRWNAGPGEATIEMCLELSSSDFKPVFPLSFSLLVIKMEIKMSKESGCYFSGNINIKLILINYLSRKKTNFLPEMFLSMGPGDAKSWRSGLVSLTQTLSFSWSTLGTWLSARLCTLEMGKYWRAYVRAQWRDHTSTQFSQSCGSLFWERRKEVKVEP
jgi:hypothetical protein